MSEITQTEKPVQTPESDNSQLNAVLYDRFVDRAHEIFNSSQEKTQEAWEKAMELARQQMTAAGEFSAEQGEALQRYLRRDLAQTMDDMQQLGTEAKDKLHPARVGAGMLSSLAKMLHAAGVALTALSEKAEGALVYRSGEITMAGTLTCTTCGHEIHLPKTSVVPVCPQCQGRQFRKSY